MRVFGPYPFSFHFLLAFRFPFALRLCFFLLLCIRFCFLPVHAQISAHVWADTRRSDATSDLSKSGINQHALAIQMGLPLFEKRQAGKHYSLSFQPLVQRTYMATNPDFIQSDFYYVSAKLALRYDWGLNHIRGTWNPYFSESAKTFNNALWRNTLTGLYTRGNFSESHVQVGFSAGYGTGSFQVVPLLGFHYYTSPKKHWDILLPAYMQYHYQHTLNHYSSISLRLNGGVYHMENQNYYDGYVRMRSTSLQFGYRYQYVGRNALWWIRPEWVLLQRLTFINETANRADLPDISIRGGFMLSAGIRLWHPRHSFSTENDQEQTLFDIF